MYHNSAGMVKSKGEISFAPSDDNFIEKIDFFLAVLKLTKTSIDLGYSLI